MMHWQSIDRNCPATVNVAFPLIVSAALGSITKALASAPVRTNFHSQPSRVALHVGRVSVILAERVPTNVLWSFSSMVTPVVTDLNDDLSTPSIFTAASEAVETPVMPPLPVIRPVLVWVPPQVLSPAKVWVVVDTMPPKAAVAFGTLKLIVPDVLEIEKAALLKVKAPVAA